MRAIQALDRRQAWLPSGQPSGHRQKGQHRHGQHRKGQRLPAALGLGLAAVLAAPLAAFWPAGGAAAQGNSYRVQLINNTCAELSITWDDGLACDRPNAPGCSIALRSNVSTNLTLNLEHPAENLKLHATGSCGGGSTAPARVAGDSNSEQVAKALRAADAPTRIAGTCVLSLRRMFPYEGGSVELQQSVEPAPIVQPAPGGGFAYQSPLAGDPFGPVGPWGNPTASITTTVPDITSPVPVALELGACTETDGVTQCGFACKAEEREGGLPDAYPGDLDNTN